MVGGRRPGGRREGAFNLKPLYGDAGLSSHGERGISIRWRGSIGVPRQGHGQSEQAVLKRLTFTHADGGFIDLLFRLHVDDASLSPHLIDDVGTSRLAGAEGQRHGCFGRGENIAGLLEHGACRDPHPVVAGVFRHDALGIADVRPACRAKEGHLDALIRGTFFDGVPLCVFAFHGPPVDEPAVTGEEHGLAIAKGAVPGNRSVPTTRHVVTGGGVGSVTMAERRAVSAASR